MNLSDFPTLLEVPDDVKPVSNNPNQVFVGYWVGFTHVRGRKKPIPCYHYVFKCNKCAEDPELFGEGLFDVIKGNLTKKGSAPCGCRGCAKPLNENQCIIKLSRVLKGREVSFKFKGWAEDFKGLETKCIFECSRHGEWSSTKLSSVFHRGAGCKICTYDNTRKANCKLDSEWVEQFKTSQMYKDGTKFVRKFNSTVKGREIANWEVTCPDCGISWMASASNLTKGTIGCKCNTFRQDHAYLIVLYDDDTPVGLKFGISYNPKERVRQLRRKNLLNQKVFGFWRFSDVRSCRDAELICKNRLQTSFICKELMSEGWTETTPLYNLEEIISIYENSGGVRLHGDF